MTANDSSPLTVALVSAVYPDASAYTRQLEDLHAARRGGASLVLLPELPLNPWSPATREARDSDAESDDGVRLRALQEAARTTGIAIVGGVIVRDASTGRRHNTAVVVDSDGNVRASYRKVHLPEEDGFWETSHYEPGDALSPIVELNGVRLGLQICSDINRPEGAHLLGAQGAHAILNPRATEAATFARWRTVLVAAALTSGCYLLSVNRPAAEGGVLLGGPSFAVAPTGEVLAETTDPIAFVTIDPAIATGARKRYPGYLATRADLYAAGWAAVAATRLPHER